MGGGGRGGVFIYKGVVGHRIATVDYKKHGMYNI